MTGKTLRRIRLSLNLTLEYLAGKVGCTRSYLSQFEQGRPIPDDMNERLETALIAEARRLGDAAFKVYHKGGK